MIVIALAVLLVAGLIGIVMATDLRDRPKHASSLELVKPTGDSFMAKETITVTRTREVRTTRA